MTCNPKFYLNSVETLGGIGLKSTNIRILKYRQRKNIYIETKIVLGEKGKSQSRTGRGKGKKDSTSLLSVLQ